MYCLFLFYLACSLLITRVLSQETVQDSWILPALPQNSSVLEQNFPYTIAWHTDLVNWFDQYCSLCNVSDLDLWITPLSGPRNYHKVASGLNLNTTTSFTWTVNLPGSELAQTDGWVLRFSATGANYGSGDNAASELEISSPVFQIIDPSSKASSSTSSSSTTLMTTHTSSATTSLPSSVKSDGEQQGAVDLSPGAKVGIGTGVSVGVILILIWAFHFARRLRMRSRPATFKAPISSRRNSRDAPEVGIPTAPAKHEKLSAEIQELSGGYRGEELPGADTNDTRVFVELDADNRIV